MTILPGESETDRISKPHIPGPLLCLLKRPFSQMRHNISGRADERWRKGLPTRNDVRGIRWSAKDLEQMRRGVIGG